MKRRALVLVWGLLVAFAACEGRTLTVDADQRAGVDGPEARAVGTGGGRKTARPPGRLVVAILWFEDKTGEAGSAHWRHAIGGALAEQLWHVKALRLRGSGITFARQQLGIAKGAGLTVEEARKIGEIIEVQRVVWGSYHRKGNEWHIAARVLNVASGKASGELTAVSEDWFELREQLTAQVLKELDITPSDSEREKMGERRTSSYSALELYSKCHALQGEGKPFSEQESLARAAVSADPNFANAHLALGSTLLSQGKFTEGEESVRKALEIDPNYATAHCTLGVVLALQDKDAEADTELHKALELEPEDAETLCRLAQLCSEQEEWDEAIFFDNKAKTLEPMDAGIRAHLGLAYAHKRDRDRAMEELKEAERLDPGGIEGANAGQLLCLGYRLLGEIPLALEHYERFLGQARKTGLNPQMVGAFEETAQHLRATLTPTFLEVKMPKV